jgi:biotin carboxylase
MAHLVFVESTRPGIRALEVAKQLGHDVTYVTAHQMDWLFREVDQANLRRHADRVIEVSDSHDPDVLTVALRALAAIQPIDAVLSTLHQFVEPCAIAARRLGVRGTSVEGIHNARDKARCRDILHQRNIPSVRHAVVRSAEEALAALRDIGYPAILKPTTGVGKVLTTMVHDEAEVREHFAHAGRAYDELRAGVRAEITLEFVLEQFAQGPLYSIELGVSAHGEHVAFAILKRKVGKHNPVLELGSTIPGDLSDAEYDTATAYATEVVQALGLDLGIFHIEMIYTAQGPRLVEVNPRIAGGAIPDLVRTATGGDLFEYLIKIYAGQPIGISRLTCTGATSHTFLAAFADCVVRPDLPVDWFEPFRTRIASGSADIAPGQALRRMDGNYDLYGVVRVTAADYAAAVRATEQLRLDVEAQLGVKLVEVID